MVPCNPAQPRSMLERQRRHQVTGERHVFSYNGERKDGLQHFLTLLDKAKALK
jgi:hypothetical protein